MPERLSPLDAAFVYLEDPNVHMHVAGLCILDPATRPGGRLTLADVEKLVRERIHLIPPFRQRLAFVPLGLGNPAWVDDPHFDLGFHLRRASLPRPGSRRQLAELIGHLHSTPLDRSRPLWESYLIDGLEDGYVASYTKTHHAMIDGISGMDVASVLFDTSPKGRAVQERSWQAARSPGRSWLAGWALADRLAHVEQAVAGGLRRAASHPGEAAGRSGHVLAGAAAFLAGFPAGRTPFNVPVGPGRRFAMAELSLDEVKAVKRVLGGTVNDVVLTVVAASLARWLEARGETVRDDVVRAMVPVSLRPDSDRMTLGNRVSSIFVDLPVGRMRPRARLHAVILATRELKAVDQAAAGSALVGLGDWVSPAVEAAVVGLATRTRFANVIVSNIPGPPLPLYLAGARLLAYYPVMPLAPRVALSVAVTSLSGVLGFGFTGDRDALPDLERLAHGVEGSFLALRKAAEA